MTNCQQEMCPYWAGDGGCPCALFDIDPPLRSIENFLGDGEDG